MRHVVAIFSALGFRCSYLVALLQQIKEQRPESRIVLRVAEKGAPEDIAAALRQAACFTCTDRVVLLPDDVFLAPDFFDVIEGAPSMNFGGVFGLRKRNGAGWDAIHPRMLGRDCNAAGVYSVAFAKHVARELPDYEGRGADHLVQQAMRSWDGGEMFFLHQPSLIQHRLGPTTIPGRLSPGPRQSETFREHYGDIV